MMARRHSTDRDARARPQAVVVPMGFVGDDASLVAALRENHPGAQVAFFNRYSAYAERLVTITIGLDRELADILQDVFLAAIRSLHTLSDPGALKPWLSRITVNTARKVLRTRKRRRWLRLFTGPEDEQRWEPPAAGLDEDLLGALRAVYEVLSDLPADEQVAFSLRFVEGMDLPEVATACGVSLSTIKRRLRRAESRFMAAATQRVELAEWLKGGTR